MGCLTRDLLLKREDLEIKKVDLGKGDFVYVRQMTGRERDRFENSIMQKVKDSNGNIEYERSTEDFRAKLAVNTLCDEKGQNLLKHTEYAALNQAISAARLEKIVTAALSLNKISNEDAEALVKNSDGGLKEDSTSGSAGN